MPSGLKLLPCDITSLKHLYAGLPPWLFIDKGVNCGQSPGRWFVGSFERVCFFELPVMYTKEI